MFGIRQKISDPPEEPSAPSLNPDPEVRSDWLINIKRFRRPSRKYIKITKPEKVFVTGSKYTGEWMGMQMWGSGTYTMLHNVKYEGRLMDGDFHGAGSLIYPSGYKVDGFWCKSHLIKGAIVYPDGLEYVYPFKYCKAKDRRFSSTIENGFNPARKERLTNEDVPRKIPPGCYDCGYGFYDPNVRCVFSVHDPTKTLKIPSLNEEKWIKRYCRKAWDEPVGYRPDLYEKWTNGSKADYKSIPSASSSDESSLESALDDVLI
ncbi:MORN repeat-containing protein 5-like [Onthophagus taurus]|uniref:MORN repeat-containing protein 5-like n=1 Tax=Onthophagus taurus TaxID=166361 RepID=UPI000C1FDFC4|nr:MORN repeat-containing protein 5-like [Onthophagus taurus]